MPSPIVPDAIQLQSIDWRQIKRLMARSTELEVYLRARLSEAAVYAIAQSPDAPPYGQGYKASFRVELDQFPDGVPVGRLVNTDPKWALIEYGTGPQRPQGGYSRALHVLERTLLQMAH